MERSSRFEVRIYYEDTDHSGVVYHPNYLKFFERARENAIDPDELSRMWFEENTGFAVYQSDLKYHAGAVFGDTVVIESSWEMDGKFKMVWTQDAYRKNDNKHLVHAMIVMVLLKNGKLIPVPVD